MNDTRLNRIRACLDDARASLRDAMEAAKELEKELPTDSGYNLALKMIEREGRREVYVISDHLGRLDKLGGPT